MDYEKRIKKKIIKSFIEEHGYAPSEEKIKEEYFKQEKRYKNIDQVGFYGLDSEKYSFQEKSSRTKENSNRERLYEDFNYQRWCAKEIRESSNIFLNSYISVLEKTLNRLSSQELRVNNLLAMKGKLDLFYHGIFENFESHRNIIFNESKNIIAEKGYVTIAGVNRGIIDIKNKRFTVRFSNSGRSKQEAVMKSAANLNYHNGKSFLGVVDSSSFSDTVKCFLTLDLEEEIYVGSVKLFCNCLNGNGITHYKLHYSIDGSNFSEVNSFYKSLDEGENFTQIGIEGVRKIKIEIKKTRADVYNKEENLYYFGLDTVELNKAKFSKNEKAEIVLGPYYLKNSKGEPVNFSIATISDSTCCIVPEKTSVSFFLSKDKTDWKFIENKKDSNSYVRFGRLEYSDFKKAEEEEDYFKLVNNNYDFIKNGNEKIFNLELNSLEFENLSKDLIIVERCDSSSDLKNGCWEEESGEYRCEFYVEEIEGRVFDFGNTYCEIDGRVRSGKIHLEKGYHKIKSSGRDWKNVRNFHSDLSSLKKEDTLYPYNHKLIIEGYNYPLTFSGEKKYFGASRIFKSKLTYMNQAKFEELGSEENFTIIEVEGKMYLKTKVKQNSMEWMKEKNNVIIYKSENNTNELYIKAVLETKQLNVAPHINSISVKVI